MNNTNIEGTIISWLIVVILAISIVWLVGIGLERAEKRECKMWKAQAENVEGFYYIEWQFEQCATHDILPEAEYLKVIE